MARKQTALQKAQAATQEREKKPSINWQVVVFPAALTLGIAALVFAGYQLLAGWWVDSQKNSLLTSVKQVRGEISTLVTDLTGRIELVSQSDQAVNAFQGPASGLATGALQLHDLLPKASMVRLLTPNVEGMDPEPYPGVGYAGLYLLLRAKETGTVNGPGLGLVQTDRAHFSFAAPVTEPVADGHRILRGLLVVRYPMSLIQEIMDSVTIGSGHFDLRTYSQSNLPMVAVARGRPVDPDLLEVLEIPGTDLNLGHHYGMLPLQTSWGMVPNLLVLFVGGGLLFWVLSEKFGWMRPSETVELEDAVAEAVVDDALESAMAFTKEAEEAAKPLATVPAEIFRAYDIRGVVGKTLNEKIASTIGQAIGSEAMDRGVSQVVVARDGRLSGPEMSDALIQGLAKAGVDVIDIGAVPTGVLYFATHHLGTDSGVMVTGSHNPKDYNGFKIVLAGETLAAENIQKLYERIEEGELLSGDGGVQEMDIVDEYVDHIASDVQVEEPLKVVVDAGNGIGGRVAPLVLEEIGCEAIPLFCEVDGEFPNHHPDPSDPANLKDLIVTVESLDADLGIALDGDADRLGVVTREGEIIYPDRLMMMFAEDVLTRNPGAAIIYDVKCTGHLAKVILNHGGSPIMWKTGHSLIKAKMKEVSAALAGEMSGHFFFQERWFGFDDGIYAAARLLEILAADPSGASAVLEALPSSVSTPEIKVEMEEGAHYRFMQEFQEVASFEGARITTIDGIRADYDDGWGLVRCSNTTPCLVLRFDANSEEALERIQGEFREQLQAVDPELELPF
ncbi:MAG: phosphomannomutase/phosphoglucomutase [Xanthomonadales bacterium]|nr:phosphomannomutase/phosphoglucomutase [Xanthomonadales bacterium]